jgi:hypothetical protein
MPKVYEFEGPDGKVYEFERPDETPEKPLGQRLAEGAAAATKTALDTTKELFRPPMNRKEAINPVLENGPFRVVRDAANKVDVVRNKITPPGTLAHDLIPSMTPESITQETIANLAGAGALRVAGKAAKPVGKLISRGLEHTSGLKNVAPGILDEIAEAPSKLFRGKGPSKALYEAGTKEGGNIFKGSLDHLDIVKKAQSFLDEGTKLTPKDALTARKSVDKLIRSGGPKDTLLLLRDQLDEIVKQSKTLGEADILHEGAVRSGAARELFPVSKRGTASELGKLLSFALDATRTAVAAPLFSPLTQATGAASLGVLRKILPFALARGGNRKLEETLNGRK